jgi:2-polyprenyl-3-methyl-5-hydroxy-6-metoxy-1,4-benzoquinol methylase
MALTRDELPCDEFDFVHTRWVLQHIPERDEVLDRLCSALRPGGVILLEEGGCFSVRATSNRS